MERSDINKKKQRGVMYFFLTFAFAVLAGGFYFIYQYNSGVSLATADTGIQRADDMKKREDVKFEPFEGAEPQFGEINVLLLGSDARDEKSSRSDTLMIGQYNQTTNAVKVVSIMRDTYVEIPGHGMQKVNAANYFGGPELVRQTIKQNFDVDVQYYAIVDFAGFTKIADIIAPDGIAVSIPYQMPYGDGMMLQPGEQVLQGDELLEYVRFRQDINSDFGRVERQQEILSKLKDKATSVHTLLNLPKLLGLVHPYIDTNVDNSTLFTIGKGLLITGESKDMETLRIPLNDSFTDKRVNGVGAVLDSNLEQNKEALKTFLAADGDIKAAERSNTRN